MERKMRIFMKYFGVVGILILLTLTVGLVSKAYAPPNLLPGIAVTKLCDNASAPGEPIDFSGRVTNTGNVDLEVTVVDDHAGTVFGPQILAAYGGYANYSGSYIPTASPSTNIVTATGVWSEGTVQAVAQATCVIETEGDEGCTPGYWKNHLLDWVGYAPGDDFDTVFGVDLFDPDINLEAALNTGGGGVNKLARHGTAALLNAAHPDLNYPLTVDEVIAAVQAGDSGMLAEYNELGCPLSGINTNSLDNRPPRPGIRGIRR